MKLERYDIDSWRLGSSLEESSLHHNLYFDSSYAQVASKIGILFTLHDSKMIPGSQMSLKKLFYVIFWPGREKNIKIYISIGIVIIKQHLKSPSMTNRSRFC